MTENQKKTQMRKKMLVERNRLTEEEIADKSSRILHHVQQSGCMERKRIIFLYCSFRSEVKTGKWMEYCFSENKEVVVPYLPESRQNLPKSRQNLPKSRQGERMQLSKLKEVSCLHVGKYGFLQPRQESLLLMDTKDIDVAIVPGSVFDRAGNRIGYGKGMYDQVLADCRPDCLKIGLAFDLQIVAHIEAEPHDVRMDGVCTESGFVFQMF